MLTCSRRLDQSAVIFNTGSACGSLGLKLYLLKVLQSFNKYMFQINWYNGYPNTAISFTQIKYFSIYDTNITLERKIQDMIFMIKNKGLL